MIRFACECGKQLQTAEENAGKRMRCPACARLLSVPLERPPAAVQLEEPAAPPSERVQQKRPILREESEPEEDFENEARSSRPASGNSGKAVVSLILGIFSLFCNVLASIPALILGLLALRDISRSKGRLSGQGLAIAGIVSACLCTLLSCGLIVPFAVLIPAVQKVREAAARVQSANNLHQMGLAMHMYHDTYGTLPAAGFSDPAKPAVQKRALLSWRVAILPYIEQQALYRRFKLDEPWDGPNNKSLLEQMPAIYKRAGDEKTPPGYTHYQVFVGNGAAFEKTQGYGFQDFTDGLANTILIIEAEKAVPWTKPEDVDFDHNKSMLPMMSRFSPSGFQVLTADGAVRMLNQQLSENTLKAAITRKGRDALGPDWR
jgi:hypothetical protein